MLARIAHELYWVGRALSRAEHTARLLDGVFHADLQGRATDAGSTRLSWEALLAIMGADSERASDRDDVISLLTLDPNDPASVLFCVSGAREGARRVRDVFSAEMWEAINTFHLGLLRRDMSAALRSGPYSLYAYVRERCALFWGVTDRTMLRDEARAFLEAGAAIEAGDMVLRMLRVALPTDEAEPTEADPRGGPAGARGEGVGGVHAVRRAVPAPPKGRGGGRCRPTRPSRPRPTRATARPSRCCRRWAASRRSVARSRRRRRRAWSARSCSTSAPTRTRSRTPCPPSTTR